MASGNLVVTKKNTIFVTRKCTRHKHFIIPYNFIIGYLYLT